MLRSGTLAASNVLEKRAGYGGPYDVTSLSLSLSKPAAVGLSLVSSVLRK